MRIFKKMSTIKLIIWLLLISSNAAARWAKEEDLSFKYDYYRKNIIVNADGSYEIETAYQATILNEAGREMFSKLFYVYKDTETFTVLEAATINGDKIYNVPSNEIEDKPLASSSAGFDQNRQVLVSLPNLEINSKIKVKSRLKVIDVPVVGSFSLPLLNEYDYINNLEITLNSKIPLNLEVIDPYKLLTITPDQPTWFNTLKIKNIRPIYSLVTEESKETFIDERKLTQVYVSSFKNWEELGLSFAKEYYQVVNQPLPSLFKEIKSAAAVLRGDQLRINTVTALLNEKMQYMGDWRTIKGRLFPRALTTIAKSQLGDCKDFSVSTAAILQELGYKAQIAFIKRGEGYRSFITLPQMHKFDHAIVKVTSKSGKVYWVDPTNVVSMSQGIFPDLVDRFALVLDLAAPTYEKVPNISPEHAQMITEEYLDLKNDAMINKGYLVLKGEQALSATAKELFMSKEQLKNAFFYMLTGSYVEEDPAKSLNMPDLTSRIVKDVEIKYQYKKNHPFIHTNLGLGLEIFVPSIIRDIIEFSTNQVSDLYLGTPRTIKNKVIIKNMQINQIEKLNYSADTPWIYFNRTCINKGDHAQIDDILVIKTNFVLNEEFKNDVYIKLTDDLKKLIKRAVLILP